MLQCLTLFADFDLRLFEARNQRHETVVRRVGCDLCFAHGTLDYGYGGRSLRVFEAYLTYVMATRHQHHWLVGRQHHFHTHTAVVCSLHFVHKRVLYLTHRLIQSVHYILCIRIQFITTNYSASNF
jgi:hypothetical protein